MTRAERPYCYGKLECVFPMGENGLRETPESCMVCYCKTECLRTAVQGDEGAQVLEEKVDRAYAAGMMGFFERWSRKKALQQRHSTDREAKKKV
ncbi:MAG: hypothetical protein JJV98_19185 [Desulfosarcina sp.]|nr:hypothetical protein [Desulfobacterales bacterium]